MKDLVQQKKERGQYFFVDKEPTDIFIKSDFF